MHKGVRKGAIYSLVGQVAGGFSLFVFHILAGRWLGVGYYGDFNALYSAVVITAGIVATGIGQGLIRFIAYYDAKDDKDAVSFAVQSSFLYYLIALFILIVVSFFLRNFITGRFFSSRVILFQQFLLGVITFSLFQFMNGLLQGYRMFRLRALFIASYGFCMLIFLYVMIQLFGRTAGGAGWSIILAPLVPILLLKSEKALMFPRSWFKFRGISVPILKFALFGTLMGFMSEWFLRSGPLLLKMLAGEEGSELAGLFSAIIMPLSVVRTVTLALFVSLYPNLSRVYSIKDSGRIRRYILKSVGLLGIILILSVIIYFFFGPQLISLFYGKAYLVSRRDTTLIAISIALYLFGLLFFRIHLSRGTPEYPSYSFLISFLVLFLMLNGLNLEPMLLVEIALLICSFLFTFLQLIPIFYSRFLLKKG